jgi:pyridoxal phosphate enzyme (YggS family)
MMNLDSIENTVKAFLASLPQGVLLVAAAKTRSVDEVKAAVRAGITVLGYNYIQEAEQIYQDVGNTVHWHMIGHLQRNKVKKALALFDMIETVDSARLAETLDRQCALQGKRMPILIEINSGKELNKSGVFPDDVDDFIKKIHVFENIKIQGLMTMGPMFGNPEDARPYFKATKAAFDRITLEGFTNVEMRYLSMGMSNSYQIAIEEGANVVRIGTKLFGERY